MQSHNVHHHHHLPPCCQRCWVLQSHGVLALMPVFIALVLPSVFAHCALAWHHRGHHPYSHPGQSGRSTPQRQQQSVPPCLANRNSLPVMPSMLSGEPSTASQSSAGAHIKRTTATRYHMLCGGHWLPPSSGASGSPHCQVPCGLHQLYC